MTTEQQIYIEAQQTLDRTSILRLNNGVLEQCFFARSFKTGEPIPQTWVKVPECSS